MVLACWIPGRPRSRIACITVGDAGQYHAGVDRRCSWHQGEIEVFRAIHMSGVTLRRRASLPEDRPVHHAAMRVLSRLLGVGRQGRDQTAANVNRGGHCSLRHRPALPNRTGKDRNPQRQSR